MPTLANFLNGKPALDLIDRIQGRCKRLALLKITKTWLSIVHLWKATVKSCVPVARQTHCPRPLASGRVYSKVVVAETRAQASVIPVACLASGCM